jgi:hypothetical protein
MTALFDPRIRPYRVRKKCLRRPALVKGGAPWPHGVDNIEKWNEGERFYCLIDLTSCMHGKVALEALKLSTQR